MTQSCAATLRQRSVLASGRQRRRGGDDSSSRRARHANLFREYVDDTKRKMWTALDGGGLCSNKRSG